MIFFTEGHVLFRHDNTPVHKPRSMRERFSQFHTEELVALSVLNLTNALVAEWKQTPAARLQHLMEKNKNRRMINAHGSTLT